MFHRAFANYNYEYIIVKRNAEKHYKYRIRFDLKCPTCVKFTRANRNRQSRRQATPSYGPQKDLYWLTLNVPIILGTRDPSLEDSSTIAR